MDYLKKEYSVAFAGLKPGKHNFDYNIGDSFFEQFENALIGKASVLVDLVLDKHDTFLILEFTFKGMVTVTCDRCADLFEMPVKGHNKLIVKLSLDEDLTEDEIVSIPPNDSSLNLAPFIYEYVSLLVPIKKVHPSLKDCNQDTLQVLDKLAVKAKTKKKDKEAETDPRWNALKKLIK